MPIIFEALIFETSADSLTYKYQKKIKSLPESSESRFENGKFQKFGRQTSVAKGTRIDEESTKDNSIRITFEQELKVFEGRS